MFSNLWKKCCRRFGLQFLVGPDATIWIESQFIQRLFKKGGEEQIEDELSAYNTLIPQGAELVEIESFAPDAENFWGDALSVLQKARGKRPDITAHSFDNAFPVASGVDPRSITDGLKEAGLPKG